jgi:hypothetical protein
VCCCSSGLALFFFFLRFRMWEYVVCARREGRACSHNLHSYRRWPCAGYDEKREGGKIKDAGLPGGGGTFSSVVSR